MSMEVLEAALAWRAAGVSVIPILANGTKRAAVEWKQYQSEIASEEQLRTWFEKSDYGLAVICGAVSGGLEMVELEGRVVEDSSLLIRLDDALIAHRVDQVWRLLENAYKEWTPSGGVHLFYYLDGPVPGNTKIANVPEFNDKVGRDVPVCRAETRGEGGYVIVAPSSGAVHASGSAWSLLRGSINQIVTIDTDQRATMHRAIAAGLDEMPVALPAPPVPAHVARDSGDAQRPGDAWAIDTPWSGVIEPWGWRLSHRVGDVEYWTRPGKDTREGVSASTREDGNLFVWSSSTGLPIEVPLSKLFVYAYYEHNGDIAHAAGALRKLGWGEERPLDLDRDTDFFDGYQRLDFPDRPSLAIAPAVMKIEWSTDGNSVRNGVIMATRASTFEIKRVRWLWEERVPIGELTLIPGREGVGKSILLANLASQITRGILRGEYFGQCRSVGYVASEDSWEHTIAPRLVAAGADMRMIYRLEVDELSGNSKGAPVLPRDITGLREMAIETKMAVLMLDPIVSLVGEGYDTNRAPELRRVLQPLRDGAEHAEIGVIGLVHYNKSSGTDVSSKVAGSRAWMEVARAAMAVARMPSEEEEDDDPGTFLAPRSNRIIVGQIKNNLGKLDLPSLTYEIQSWEIETNDGFSTNVGRVVWGDPTDMTIDEAVERGNKASSAKPAKGDAIVSFIKKEWRRTAMGVSTQELIERFGDDYNTDKALMMEVGRLVKKGRLERLQTGMYRPYGVGD